MWMWICLAFVLVLGSGFAAMHFWPSKYYKQLFAEETFREFHRQLSADIRTVLAEGSHTSDTQRNEEASRTFVLEPGLRAVVSHYDHEGQQVLHFSLGQHGRHTTRAVGNLFGSFILAMLHENKMQVDPFATEQTSIHHLVVLLESQPVTIAPFSETWAAYTTSYRHETIPFRFESMSPEEFQQLQQDARRRLAEGE